MGRKKKGALEREMANSSQRNAFKDCARHSQGPYVKQPANRLKERRMAKTERCEERYKKKKRQTECTRKEEV